MTPIERVARAILATETHGDWSPPQLEDIANAELYYDKAKASIAAMMEPSERMVTAAENYRLAGYDMQRSLSAAIQAALDER